MATTRRQPRPGCEVLEGRLALSAGHAAPADVPAGDTLAVLRGFTQAYLSRVGDPNYNPAYDLNHNGQIGQVDGRLLIHALPPLSPKVPINISLTLAPADRAKGPLPQNSGGVTHSKQPTVLGHTTPGALVFTGSGTVDLKLHGPALVADANGNFAYTLNLTDGINQLDFQAVNHFGRQVLRAFPIYWLNFAQYENAHPAKT